MGVWDELNTNVDVILDISQLDSLIETLNNDPVLSPAVSIAEQFKKGIENGAKKGALKIAKTNKSLQELAIATNASMFTNKLLNSIDIEQKDDYSYIVGTNITHFYPLCVEKGRKEVRPVFKKVLHYFTLSGVEIFSKYSRPAQPRPFVKPAYDNTKSRANDIVKEEIYNATTR